MSLYTFDKTDGLFCINWSCVEKVRVKVKVKVKVRVEVRIRVNPYFDRFFLPLVLFWYCVGLWSCYGLLT